MRGMYAAVVSGCVRRWCLLVGFALCCPVLSWASSAGDLANVRQISSGWDVVYKATTGAAEAWGSRSYSAAATAGEVAVSDYANLTFLGRSAAPGIAVTVTRTVAWGAVARAAAVILPIAGTAAAGYEIWTALRCKQETGSIFCDPGSDVSTSGSGSTSEHNVFIGSPPYAGYQTVSGWWAAQGMERECPSSQGYTSGTYTMFNDKTITVTCVKQATVCSDGSLPSTWDMKCSTGHLVKMSVDEAAALMQQYGGTTKGASGKSAKDQAVAIVKDAVSRGVKVETGSATATGPASQVGQSTSSTTTGPNGTSTVTKTPTYNYTYNTTNEGAKITYNTTNSYTTTVTNTAGDTTTTTTTETDAEEQKTDCDKNPDAVACVEFGEVDDEDVNKVDKSVTVAAESVALPSGCPAPVTVAGYTLSYDAACTFSRGVSPFVIAAAGIMAALIVIRSVQGA